MQDAPAGRVVQARDQVGEGGLAGAAGPDQRHQLPGLDAESDVFQGIFARLAVDGCFDLHPLIWGCSRSLRFVVFGFLGWSCRTSTAATLSIWPGRCTSFSRLLPSRS